MNELKRFETATYVQYTGDNLLEIINFTFDVGMYSVIIEKTDEGKFVGIGVPSLNGACAPLSGPSVLTPGDFLVRWEEKGLHVIRKREFERECLERGFVLVSNEKHFEKSSENSDTKSA